MADYLYEMYKGGDVLLLAAAGNWGEAQEDEWSYSSPAHYK
jgi:hypothetical protein